MSRKYFADESKTEVVRQVTDRGYSVSEVAKPLKQGLTKLSSSPFNVPGSRSPYQWLLCLAKGAKIATIEEYQR